MMSTNERIKIFYNLVYGIHCGFEKICLIVFLETKQSCDTMVNGGQELEMGDLIQALDTVHDILSNKSKPMWQKNESRLQ